MKKALLVLTFLLVAALMIFGCGEDEKTFTVGFDAEFPPYGFVNDDGQYVGFDLDLAREVADRNGWEIKLQPISWDAKDMELNSGNIDCIWNGFTMSEERLDKYTWSDPYVDNSQVFVVPAAEAGLGKSVLSGKVVAVQAASSAAEALNSEESKELKASFKKLLEVPDYNTAFLNLDSGAVQAIAMDIGVAKYQLDNRDGKYAILNETLLTEKYGIGFKKGNTELCEKVQTTLYEMVDDGKFAEIAEKYGLTDSIILGK